jgi:hypothetical protein
MVSPSDAVPGSEETTSATERVQEATEDHAAAEGAESSSKSLGSRSSIQEMLLSTEPNTPLASVDSPWNPDLGGVTRIYRGLQKMLGFDGMPAVVDVVVGAAEFIHEFEPDTGESSEEADQESTDAGESRPITELEGAEVA